MRQDYQFSDTQIARFCKDQAVMMPVSNGIESDIQVLIAHCFILCFILYKFDAATFQGMDTLNFGVKASDGALSRVCSC